MNSVKVWTAFAVGVTAGACVALLYAPQSGDATRRQIRENVEDAGDYLRDKADHVQGRLRDTADNIRDKAEHLQDRAQDYARRGRDVVDDLVESARRTVKA